MLKTMSREEILEIFQHLEVGDYIYSSGYNSTPEDNFAFIARVVDTNFFEDEIQLRDIWAVDGAFDGTWWLNKRIVHIYKIFRVI